MTKITISVLNDKKEVKVAKRADEGILTPLTETALDFAHLSAWDMNYDEGDKIVIETDGPGNYLMVKLDETLETSFIYMNGTKWTYSISFNENRTQARPEFRFAGGRHYISARLATKEEITSYRNLALNPHDMKDYTGAYPHAHANVETRNDATFFACNAIDGVFANHSHGLYPYQSWGINRQADAALTIDFGRKVTIDKIGITLRADFPHDSTWSRISIAFSNGTKETFNLEKTYLPQYFSIESRTVTSVVFGELIKDADPSPFPALTQLELFGYNIIEDVKEII